MKITGDSSWASCAWCGSVKPLSFFPDSVENKDLTSLPSRFCYLSIDEHTNRHAILALPFSLLSLMVSIPMQFRYFSNDFKPHLPRLTSPKRNADNPRRQPLKNF